MPTPNLATPLPRLLQDQVSEAFTAFSIIHKAPSWAGRKSQGSGSIDDGYDKAVPAQVSCRFPDERASTAAKPASFKTARGWNR